MDVSVENFMFGRPKSQNLLRAGAYAVVGDDRAYEITEAPASSVGAPLPHVLAGEHELFLIYLAEDTSEDWDGSSVRMVGSTSEEPVAVIRFSRFIAHFSGPPNDEAFGGHPLSGRGLHPYGCYEIKPSSWIDALERMNSVHPYHNKDLFTDYRHFAFTFHDSVFECVAHTFSVHSFERRTVRDAIRSVVDLVK